MQKIANIILSKKFLLFLVALIFFTVFYRFFNLLSFPDSQTPLEKGELFKLQPRQSLSQTFFADRNGLAKIEFLMRTPGPKEGDIVEMEILDKSCSKIVRKGELQKSFLNSDNLYEFEFSKISDSKEQIYCLKATLQPLRADSKYIRFFTVENNDPQIILRDSSSGQEVSNQKLSIRGVYKNNHWWQDIDELSQRISQYKPFFLKHYFLYVIVVLFLVLSVSLAVIFIVI